MRLTSAATICALLGITVALRAQSRESITGRILFVGAPSAVAHVLLEGSAGFANQAWTADGRFAFVGVAPGAYTVLVRANGFEDGFAQVMVPVQDDVSIVLRPSKNSTTKTVGIASVFEHQVPKSARKEFAIALRAVHKDDCATAIEHLRKAIAMFQNYGDAHNEAGICQVRNGSVAAAEASFREAIRATSDVAPSLNLADIYIKQGRLAEAETVLDTAIQRNPAAGNGYYGLAALRFQQGRLDDAESLAQQAHRHEYHLPDVHILLAKIYDSKADADAVRRELQQYVKEARPSEMRSKVQQELKRQKSRTIEHLRSKEK